MHKSNTIDYTIIIPHRDQLDHLRRCVHAALDQETELRYEVLVIHDGVDHLEIDHPRLRQIQAAECHNPYILRNQGIRSTAAKYVAFLDAKCVPDKHWLDRLVSRSKKENYRIIAGRYDVLPASSHLRDQVYGLMYLNNAKNVHKGYGVTTGNLLVERALFDRVGAFGEDIATGQDIAWTKRALDMGYTICYEDAARVQYTGQSYHQLKNSVQKYALGIYRQDTHRLTRAVTLLLPWRMSTLRGALTYRQLESLPITQKVRLWLHIWRLKRVMAMRYIRLWVLGD